MARTGGQPTVGNPCPTIPTRAWSICRRSNCLRATTTRRSISPIGPAFRATPSTTAWISVSPPDLPGAGTSYLQAWDPVRQRSVWRVPTPSFWNGGTMTSAGNLVFQGQIDSKFNAYAADTGRLAWSFDAGAAVIAPPITYSVGGRQYVTVLSRQRYQRIGFRGALQTVRHRLSLAKAARLDVRFGRQRRASGCSGACTFQRPPRPPVLAKMGPHRSGERKPTICTAPCAMESPSSPGDMLPIYAALLRPRWPLRSNRSFKMVLWWQTECRASRSSRKRSCRICVNSSKRRRIRRPLNNVRAAALVSLRPAECEPRHNSNEFQIMSHPLTPRRLTWGDIRVASWRHSRLPSATPQRMSLRGNLMIKKIGLVVLLATLSSVASAHETCTTKYLFGFIPYPSCTRTSDPVAAPEIDPASAMAGLTLLMGGLAVLRGRRFNNTKA